MDGRTVATYAVEAVVVVLVVSLLLGQVLGYPVLISFVETDSMAPTIEAGDGFIAVPAGLAGPIEPGDVVVFDAQQLHGGGYVTHRVVGVTDEGYVTKGDANPFTDQSASWEEPPVQREQIVAVALQVGGTVVVIPKVGLAVMGSRALVSGIQTQLSLLFGSRAFLGTQGLAYLLFAIGLVVYLASLALERQTGRRRVRIRESTNPRKNLTTAILALTLVLVLVLTASMALTGGTQQIGFVSSDTDAPGAGVIPRGGSENVTYTVPSNGAIPAVVFLEPTSDDVEVTPTELYVPSGESVNATVTLHAPPERGYYRRYVVEHRYLPILPRGTIRSLYRVHPWAPILVMDALIGTAFFGFAAGFVGMGQTRVRSRSRDLPLSVRVRRWLR